MTKDTCWIGISLGSQNASLATTGISGNVEVIANEDGDRLIPVCVSFGQQDFLIGTQAKNQLISNPKNTLEHFINSIGKNYDEVSNQSNVIDCDGMPKYQIEVYPPYDEENEDAEVEPEINLYTPEDISVKYLETLKKSAENYVGKEIEGCVVSIPISKVQNDCNELKNVIKKAGFKYVQTISEPAAAVLSYFDRNGEESSLCDKNILVADLGGQSFNSCLIKNSYGILTVLANDECNVGGQDFDNILINYFKNEFQKKNGIDITDNRRAMTKLRLASEKTKRTLSRSNMSPCSVDSLAEGIDMHSTINKMRFDMLSSKLINKCLDTVEDTVEKSNIDFEDIDEVLIIGGASRMPKFQSKLISLFEERTEIKTDIEPDEAVSMGCAIQAKLLSEKIEQPEYKKYLEENEVKLPHLTQSIGIENNDGDFIPIIPKNTVLPATRYIQCQNEQTPIYLAIYQGENEVAAENKLVSQVVIDDLINENASKPDEIKIRINLSTETLVIVAQNLSTKKSSKITIKI